MHDLIIIGAGPAGTAAAVYAARKKLKTVLITEEWGGQSTVSDDIQNWIGIPHISGADMAKAFKAHVTEYAGDVVTIDSPAKAAKVVKNADGSVTVETDKEKSYTAHALLITVGSRRRKLPAKGADEFEHKGLTYCASCDGPLFSGQDVVVVGGGNAGFESAAQLLAYVQSVTLLEHGDTFKADPVTVEKLQANKNFIGITNADTVEIHGDGLVTGLTYKDNKTNEEKKLDVTGVFVEIGLLPNTELLEGVVELNKYKQVVINKDTQKTSVPGIWAAGDCTDVLYHQNNIAAGDAVRALEDIYKTLKA
jgi:alkyl hydroperoxide reductase subunit F